MTDLSPATPPAPPPANADATARLLDGLRELRCLNPDLASRREADLLRLADAAGPETFPEAAALALELVTAYESSPWKQSERTTIADYLRRLEHAARRLPSGDTAAEPASGDTATVALVPVRACSPLDWCRLLAGAGVSQAMLNAMEAARNRNRLVGTVLETTFRILRRLDPAAATAWERELLETRRGHLDPELARDLLRVWLDAPRLPAELQAWPLRWSADENLARQWPAVTEAADNLLRRDALRGWEAQAPAAGAAALLRRRIREGRTEEDELLHWLTLAVAEVGGSARFFTGLAQHTAADAGASPDWVSGALLREARRVASLFLPLLLLADLLLRHAGGAHRFAMAVFGLDRAGRGEWRRALEERARGNVRRLFLFGLRAGTPPEQTIRRLCFGDAALFERLRGELGLPDRHFDSVRQLDKVVDSLTVHYANHREEPLLTQEIRRRYHNLMRVLHEDSLRLRLGPEGLEQLAAERDILTEILAIAAAARRFLALRRNLAGELEERVAADLEFTQGIRRRRLQHLRRLLAAE